MTFIHNGIRYELKNESEKLLDIFVENLIDELWAEGKDSFNVGYKDVFDNFLEGYGTSMIKDMERV